MKPFFKIAHRVTRKKSSSDDVYEIYPDFFLDSDVIMIRSKTFYAVWNDENKMWCKDEALVPKMVDSEIRKYILDNELQDKNCKCMFMDDFNSGSWIKYKKFISLMHDNYVVLDQKLKFLDDKTVLRDYVSRKLPYNLDPRKPVSYNRLMSVLYSQDNRDKLEWAVGSIFAGDSGDIQKFIVLFGDSGTGKSTFLNILMSLFPDQTVTFNAKDLGSSQPFATSVFRNNPLVAIQHDGDLSRIEDNTKINTIVSHEPVLVNEKFKTEMELKLRCILFMGTNSPVKITDIKSGFLRRLLDVRPTGDKIPYDDYLLLCDKIKFETGKIANQCLETYRRLGKDYYNNYIAKDMLSITNDIYGFMEEHYFLFKKQNYTTLSQAYELYKKYCDDAGIVHQLPRRIIKEELKSYFDKHVQLSAINGKNYRNVYRGFKFGKFNIEIDEIVDKVEQEGNYLIRLFNDGGSIFDEVAKEYKAQYASGPGIPEQKWNNVETRLKDLDTKRLHYVQLPTNHIVIDFDLKDEAGNKSLDMNLKAASKFPETYCEVSRSGNGLHLHYIFDNDPLRLAKEYSPGIEIKVFTGNSALRRILTFCNKVGINHISDGLPYKTEGKTMIKVDSIKSEVGLRKLIDRNLAKEIHSATKPSIDFIKKILDDCYNSDIVYDVSDLRNKILNFALKSTNNSEYCVNVVNSMKFSSKREPESIVMDDDDSTIVFFDVEVFPNLFIIVTKKIGDGVSPVIYINPESKDVEDLFKLKLVGFNCRRYDNHILYARYLGYSNEQLHQLSANIINGNRSVFFREAYDLSYTDVYDFCSVKKSLKMWEIDLGIDHLELRFKWDEPVPKESWQTVVDYCVNDVLATEQVFRQRKDDWIARKILADLADGVVNDTTNMLTTKFIFGSERHPKLVYTDLATGEQS